MATLALAAAGSAIGSTIGGTFLGVGASTWGWSIGSIVGNLLFPQKGPDQHTEGPRFSDLKVQTSAYGAVIPIVAGAVKITGNVIWSRPIREVATTTSQRTGGKGGGGQTVSQTTYRYYADFAVLLCEGECVGFRKAWINEELKFNVADTATSESIFASALQAQYVRFYSGSETQSVDPLIYADKGADTPAYRGSCYVVIEGMDVTPYNGRIPQMAFEVIREGSLADLAVPTVANLGTSDGSSFVVLGRSGNIWAGAVTATADASRWNFYSGAKVGSYDPPSYTYTPSGLTYDGEAIATGSSGGVLAVLHEDGSTTRYTGAFANMGAGLSSNFYSHGIVAESSDVWWARGDSGSSNSFFRAVVGDTSLTTTQLSGVFCFALARNACGIAGRVYMQAATSSGGTKYLSYVDTASSSLVQQVQVTTMGGILVASDGYVWLGPADSAAERKTLRKYDQDGTLILTVDVDNTEALTSGWSPFEDANGVIWAVGIISGANRRVYQIHPTTGTVIARSALFVGLMLGFTEDNRAVIWDSSTGSFILKEVERLPRITTAATPLTDFLTELVARVGLAPADVDLTDLAADNVAGYAIARRDSLRSDLGPLQIAYRFDVVESDNVLKFVKRGGAVVADIPEDDLAARFYGQNPPPPVAAVRKLETELPREVAVEYMDADAHYQIGTQYARRLTGLSQDVASMDMPMVLTADEAAECAELVLYERWASRNTITLTLSREYADLEPTDVITVTSGTITYTLRIVDKLEAGGLITLTCVTEDADVYSPVSVGIALPAVSEAVSTGGPTMLRLLDIPLLRDVDDGPGIYAAAAGYFAGWTGAELWVSRDEGTTYEPTETSFIDSTVMGSALTVLATFVGGNVFDETNSVQVQVYGGELSSSTSDLVLAGANAAYLGGELIGFRTATLDAAGRYTLTGLLRGRKGTEQYMTTHAIGDQFVLLDSSTMRRVVLTTADIGASLIFKAPSFGQQVAEAAAIPFTPAAVGLEPLAPVHIRAGRTANASWDITIAWTRRARKGAEWRDYVDVPVDDTPEAYEVEIYSSSAFTTLKRTITGLSSATATYTSAQQVTDFGTNQTTIYVKVYQVSATTGRGFAGTATINV